MGIRKCPKQEPTVSVVQRVCDTLRDARFIEEWERVVSQVDERELIRSGIQRCVLTGLVMLFKAIGDKDANLVPDPWLPLRANDNPDFGWWQGFMEKVVGCRQRRGRHGGSLT